MTAALLSRESREAIAKRARIGTRFTEEAVLALEEDARELAGIATGKLHDMLSAVVDLGLSWRRLCNARDDAGALLAHEAALRGLLLRALRSRQTDDGVLRCDHCNGYVIAEGFSKVPEEHEHPANRHHRGECQCRAEGWSWVADAVRAGLHAEESP